MQINNNKCDVEFLLDKSITAFFVKEFSFVAIRFSFYGCKSICLRFGASGWW